jgi:hypothetical protein
MSLLPSLNSKVKREFDKRASVEPRKNSVMHSPIKLNNTSFSELSSPERKENSHERRGFLKQIDQEYSSTGA